MTDEEMEKALAAEAAKGGHPVLSPAELKAAKASARKQIEEERKDAAIKRVIEEETERLRREEGLVSGDTVGDEIVKITIDLPEHAASITVNGTQFWHGHTYDVPRHVANSLRETMSRAHAHQMELDGKDMAHAIQNRRNSVISGKTGIANAPQGM